MSRPDLDSNRNSHGNGSIFFSVIISAVSILGERSLGMVEATIEDLAFPSRYSKESDEVGRRGLFERSEFRSAENSDEEMALKI